ncbi:Serine/Threonine protein kinases active-site signature [Nakaseomyces glabratus]|nr:Serine/Threonine protein kinases active-site signature [Nakaseomyces glabratus]KAH7590336.1 Serine/Threonine protein kinases active-site signature [Nakaseomyces glabratus]
MVQIYYNENQALEPMQHNQANGIWKASYMDEANADSKRFAFTNPWGNEKIDEDEAMSYNYSNANSTADVDMNSDMYKRRKSSLVVPPSRAAAPNPFQYETMQNSTGTAQRAMYPESSAYQQQRQIMVPHQQQGQLASRFNSRFVPSLYNPQEFQRRQSLATAQFSTPSSLHGSASNQAFNTGSGNNGVNLNYASANVTTNNSSTYLSAMTPNVPMEMGNIPLASPHRRLSAFPTSGTTNSSLQPPFKQLRRDEGSPRQIVIPQMHRCHSKNDLQPCINPNPKFRRASLHSNTISPLIGLTKSLLTTYALCSPDFTYQTSKNPKRVLTKPSEGKYNNGYDNVNSDYILYVNDVLGTEQNRKYLVLDILGQGTFGQVVKCQNLQTKEIIAVKVVKSRSEYLNQSISEAKILELLNEKIDPNNKHHFLRMHDSFVHKNHLCLVFELLSNNLYELLKQNKFHGLSIQLIRTFTIQILDSLCVLKDSKLIHCDLKPENILLCSPDKPDLKVIDFGSSCEETRTVYTYIQSRFYRAPEIILGIPYSTSIDMWSLGCIVAELFLGIPIFPGSSEFNQLTRIITTLGYPPTWMIDMGKSSHKFLKKLNTLNLDMTNINDVEAQNNNANYTTANRMQKNQPTAKYRLKTIEEFNRDNNASEKVGKQYFKWAVLEDIIRNYRIHKNIQKSPELIEQEMKNRECLIHFLKGILNLNPLERWTPQQAAMHPFITQQPFTGKWFPPGSFNTMNTSNFGSQPRQEGNNSNNMKPNSQEGPTKEFTNLKIIED